MVKPSLCDSSGAHRLEKMIIAVTAAKAGELQEKQMKEINK